MDARPDFAEDLIQVRQEYRDHVGAQRNRHICQMTWLAGVNLFFSLVAGGLGLAFGQMSGSDNNWMFGTVTAWTCGGIGLFVVLICLGIILEGKRSRGDKTTCCMRHLLMWLVIATPIDGMMWFAGTLMIYILEVSPCWEKEAYRECSPNEDINIKLSIATIIIYFLRATITIAIASIFCCNQKQFGVKSGFETTRLSEVTAPKTDRNNPMQSPVMYPGFDSPNFNQHNGDNGY